MRRGLAGALLLLCLAAPAMAASLAESCAAPAALVRLHGSLARTALRLARHEAITIVAVGSSSTTGFGASDPARTYPSQLAAELRRRLPGERIAVMNEGVNGETAAQMLARFDRDVLAFRPDLVIWQVGTNAVLRDHDVAADQDMIRRGVERLKTAGADVVLMDMQFAPMVTAHARYRAMEQGLAEIGKQEGIPVFRRFALMQHWVEAGQLTPATMLAPDGLHMNDLSYGCIGRLLGDAILERAQAGSSLATSRP
ncbi:MAG TPA: GDSL-type esterase/lipase family protein [Stellaceae bacterium]|nr:GDSL-type esterase/lipase family protein [Stellaceae bacterium]